MAEHAVKYWSESRGELVEIGTMPTRHLSNAAKKMLRTLADGAAPMFQPDGDTADAVLAAMIDELASRIPAKEA